MKPAALSILLLPSLAWNALGQAPTDIFEKAPPGVEEALRERVMGFYKTWEEGKFRQGEKYVSDDAQEAYYGIQKQKLEHCEIIRIRYERDFNDAIVTITCKGKWNIQGQMLDHVMAHSDTWSLEKDQWVWTVKPVKKVESPFGPMSAYGNIENSQGLFNQDTGIPKDAAAVTQLGQGLLNQISVDKNDVMLSSFEKKSEVITIRNGINGSVDVTLNVEGGPLGFKATIDRTQIPAFEAAKVTLSYDPGKDLSAKPFAMVRITVDQFNKTFPVRVQFAIPEELQKLLDRSRTGK